jgi:HAD superfamily hydrolase (TIGR01490 family)
MPLVAGSSTVDQHPATDKGRYPRLVSSADGAQRAAAFFDLDKTVIAKASMVAFSRPLHRAGLLSRRLMLRAAWAQLVYAQVGASPEKLEKLRERVLSLTKGWEQSDVTQIVRDTLEDVIEPIVFDEAIGRIRQHQAWGHRVFIVSAAPEEVVAPIAQLLGVDEAIATRAELDEHGRYSGRTERYVYGPEKEVAILDTATRDHLDLSASWAYSDSATDIPMLSAVGHPVAVNPDRELARAAKDKGWPIERWTLEVPLRDRVPMPAPKQAAVGGGAAVLGAAALAGWWWWRRAAGAPAPQASRTFLAAKAARLTRTMSSNSFFMRPT